MLQNTDIVTINMIQNNYVIHWMYYEKITNAGAMQLLYI